MSKNYAVIMAGGSGTRFWPESTKSCPKQYLSLIGDKSLFTKTLDRFEGLIDAKETYVVTVESQKQLVLEHALSSSQHLSEEEVIIEPAARNTAPCLLLTLASLISKGAKQDDVVAIFPADHVILNQQGFQGTLRAAISFAKQKDSIVTIGITPHFPHTGYGYIWRGKQEDKNHNIYEAKAFREKPDAILASEYVASGEYYWNAGMFICKLGVLFEEFQQHAPELTSHFEELLASLKDQTALAKIYAKLAAISVDYAIMEKSKRVAIIPANFDWNDLGSWDALEAVCEVKDKNTLVGKNKKFFFENSIGNVIRTKDDQFIALIDVNDLIVVNHENALLIMPKQSSQKVKKVVDYLQTSEWGKNLL